MKTVLIQCLVLWVLLREAAVYAMHQNIKAGYVPLHPIAECRGEVEK